MKIKFNILMQDKNIMKINQTIYLLKFIIIFSKMLPILLIISQLDNRIKIFFISDNSMQNKTIRNI